ncbi:oxygen-insensitive NADPH nitroreductase [Erysipelothrix rhusiopathiae]|nr:oxygen-insensitive NADPH nitroreductase [Erysipelothrix rhusiopathiae]MDE8093026.1 oxygen-insensitive NADPH nitroreductase [Erysipelothrix rhusiopathiae]MDE8098113.1 oxygen-insensitive NADPH nitroreductase [Erysipelothrix rhusiopathiae]MDE8106745.1 oxygen-insensitive NADPH nitroreductase [Erysipelothrix rhusiopathiae]MDE8108414.1 oxygen-insensitive NADPH nitroreductase [Erysipelothrix rhusiopathiae]
MNNTIKQQLNHRTIRQFTDEPISQEIIDTLVSVAQATSTSNYMQSYSIISITDKVKKKAIASIGAQPYIENVGHLFIFVIDQHRNATIAKEGNIEDIEVLQTFDRMMIGYTDAILAAQNTMVAIESMGMGGVFLGSILNDAQAIIDVLELPEYVFPVLGLGFGYPNQEPQLKPRMPQHLMHFENRYPKVDSITNAMCDYDETVTEYYDLRDANKRIDSFTNQIKQSMSRRHPSRMQLKETMNKQKLGIK